MFCYNCGGEICQGDIYCCWCGTDVQVEDDADTTKEPITETNATKQRENKQTGALIKQVGMMSYYEGEPTVSFSAASGNIVIYDNRIEFEKKWGSSKGAMFGLIGMAVANKDIKEHPLDIFYFKDIKNVRTGKYTVYITFVMEMKDGRTMTFVPIAPNNMVANEMCAIISRYL